ncbi:hypothetical protein, partial [Streptomyces californicus]|uniref:hypothetical protein n=1 Tax=Streptomyces californicus TaxID=67351 RepID=UPI0033EEE0EF
TLRITSFAALLDAHGREEARGGDGCEVCKPVRIRSPTPDAHRPHGRNRRRPVGLDRRPRARGLRHSENMEIEGNCTLWRILSSAIGPALPPGPGYSPGAVTGSPYDHHRQPA